MPLAEPAGALTRGGEPGKGQPEVKWILLVTWIVHSQPPRSYQVEFDHEDHCMVAKFKVSEDASKAAKIYVDRLDWASRQPGGIPVGVMLAGRSAPQVVVTSASK
jgi:hypothetical protein